MVMTIEPGVYFIDAFLDPALADPNIARFFDLATLHRYRSKVGGVRIEDDVVITEDGIDNLSTPFVPSSMEEIEALMALAWRNELPRDFFYICASSLQIAGILGIAQCAGIAGIAGSEFRETSVVPFGRLHARIAPVNQSEALF